MGTKTSGDLALEKPNRGEYLDSWDTHLNDNSDRVETGASYAMRSVKNASGNFVDTEIINISGKVIGTADGLQKRLDKISDADGNVKGTQDVVYSRDDRLVGTQQGLFDVLAKIERYIFWLAQGQVDSGANIPDRLIKELGRRGYYSRDGLATVATVAATSHGGDTDVPVLSPVGGNVIEADISGRTYRIRDDLFAESGTLVGKARGVALLYLEPAGSTPSTAGTQLIYEGTDGEFEKIPDANSPWRKFTSTSNPSLVNARAGDVLRISNKIVGSYDIAGDYIIESDPVGDSVTIIGGLPAEVDESEIKNCIFQILNIWAAKLDYIFFASPTQEFQRINLEIADPSDKAFIGEVWWDGGAVTGSPFAYKPLGVYDSGWLAAPAGPPTALAQVGAIAHNVGAIVPPYQADDQEALAPTVKIFSARKDVNNNIYDIQEMPFNPYLGGSAGASAGWFGYVDRKYIEFQYGVELYGDVDPTYKWGYQRKIDIATFPNDPLTDASYEYDQANAVYRVIVTK